MKTKNRFLKAVAVVFLIGIGVFNNSDYHFEIKKYAEQTLNETEQSTEKVAQTETTKRNLVDFTITVVTSTMKQIISNR